MWLEVRISKPHNFSFWIYWFTLAQYPFLIFTTYLISQIQNLNFFFDIASSKNVLNRSHPTFLCFTILKIKITDAIIHHHTKTGSILTAITRRLFFFDHAFSPTSNSILIMNCQIIYGIWIMLYLTTSNNYIFLEKWYLYNYFLTTFWQLSLSYSHYLLIFSLPFSFSIIFDQSKKRKPKLS